MEKETTLFYYYRSWQYLDYLKIQNKLSLNQTTGFASKTIFKLQAPPEFQWVTKSHTTETVYLGLTLDSTRIESEWKTIKFSSHARKMLWGYTEISPNDLILGVTKSCLSPVTILWPQRPPCCDQYLTTVINASLSFIYAWAKALSKKLHIYKSNPKKTKWPLSTWTSRKLVPRLSMGAFPFGPAWISAASSGDIDFGNIRRNSYGRSVFPFLLTLEVVHLFRSGHSGWNSPFHFWQTRSLQFGKRLMTKIALFLSQPSF